MSSMETPQNLSYFYYFLNFLSLFLRFTSEVKQRLQSRTHVVDYDLTYLKLIFSMGHNEKLTSFSEDKYG